MVPKNSDREQTDEVGIVLLPQPKAVSLSLTDDSLLVVARIIDVVDTNVTILSEGTLSITVMPSASPLENSMRIGKDNLSCVSVLVDSPSIKRLIVDSLE